MRINLLKGIHIQTVPLDPTCTKGAKAKCKILTDNKTNKIYVDGVLVFESDGRKPEDRNLERISFEIDDCASSLTIYALNWEAGCSKGGVRLDCTNGNSARWRKVNGGDDHSNWRVHFGYIEGAQAASSTYHLDWPSASRSTGGYARPSMCGPGNKWTFRRDMHG